PANALVPLPRIAGHRDGDSTDCPGDVLYGELRAIRGAVGALAPKPVRATLALSAAAAPPAVTPPPPPQGVPAPPSEPTPASVLSGAVTLLDGTPIVGAVVQIQQRSVARRGQLVAERTIAQVVTDTAGAWSLPVALTPGVRGRQVALRALYAGAGAGAGGTPGAGASVSEPIAIADAAVTPQVA
ncbi:MAG: hypothetical protein QOC77_3362, partial [Thermoleophilaceae bacterium]|nr:hypothetical protein [Thermoleophilaceae bacterium]